VNIEVERGGVSTHGPSRPRVSDHDTRPVRAPVRRSARRARRRARRWCVLSVSPTGFVDLDVKRRGATGQQTRGPQSVETRGLGPLTPPCKAIRRCRATPASWAVDDGGPGIGGVRVVGGRWSHRVIVSDLRTSCGLFADIDLSPSTGACARSSGSRGVPTVPSGLTRSAASDVRYRSSAVG